MKTFGLKEIRSWQPCYDPNKYLPEDWNGTALDILNLQDIPYADRLWVVLRTELISERTMRLFAVWCARQIQHLIKDQRSLDALVVAEKFSLGEASQCELEAACAAARDAAGAAWAATCAAARDAAEAAVWAAAAWDARAPRDARAATHDAQIAKLKEMIEIENL